MSEFAFSGRNESRPMTRRFSAFGFRISVLSLVAAFALAGTASQASALISPARAGWWDCMEMGIVGESGVYVGTPYPVGPIYWPGLGSGSRAGYSQNGCAAPDDYVATYTSNDGAVRIDGLVLQETGLSKADQLATAPAVGDRGVAHIEAARVRITTDEVTIEATGVQEDAAYECSVVGARPVATTQGRVETLFITTRSTVSGKSVETTARFGPITKRVKIPIGDYGHVIVNGGHEETGNRTYGNHDPYGYLQQSALRVQLNTFDVPGIVTSLIYYPEGNPCAAL